MYSGMWGCIYSLMRGDNNACMATSTFVAACHFVISGLIYFTGDQLVWPPCWPNGVDYPVREGCSKYDFTVEQIEQKEEKRTRVVSVSVCLCLCVWGGREGMCVGI